MINPLRGMRDSVDEFSKKYLYFIENCSRIATNYGFSFIETPILEETALFKRSVGESSDIVGKEMYRFIDKGKNDVCMRPEGTAGVVRAFITNKYDRVGGVKRFFYHGPMFRYERPQKGRLRQFHQFGIETFGIQSVQEDAMIIVMLKEMFDFFNINYRLELNSLGCVSCMPIYKKKLVLFLKQIDGLCEDCRRRENTNPIRVLDCKSKNCQNLLKNAPLLIENLCSTCSDDFSQLREILSELGVKYEINNRLVRGLDYYNKTAFEFISDDIGAKSAIAGGGRYDKLVEFLGGKETFGVGFAMGIERILDIMDTPCVVKKGYYIGSMSKNASLEIMKLAVKIREDNVVNMQYANKSLNAHLKAANKANARYFICIGDDELMSKNYIIKDLDTKEYRSVKLRN